ncbi:hypothetical protein [Glycomyces tenuis]|uniref:hypothetical protein n=1 Tax=Glycomyces tenuis TaxID=58116 RepID=UPI000416E1B0|nr:hypothetical protein [Glycomyces tenuis]
MSDSYSGSDIAQYDEPDVPDTRESMGSSIPVVKSGYKLVEDIKAAYENEDPLAAAKTVPADIAVLGLEAAFALKDPIFTLVQAGLTIVLELVEPLNDALESVSGDPDEMARTKERWGQISTALEALSGEVGSSIGADLSSWQGSDADSALEQLRALEAIILAASSEAANVQTLLSWAETLAETIYAVIKSIIAELVSWLVTNGLVALALSPATFGSSVAGFLVRASIKGSMMFTRAFSKLEKAFGLFGKIGKVLYKLLAKSSYRGNPKYKLWVSVLAKAGIGGGLAALAPGAGAVTNELTDGPATVSTPGGGSGQVNIDLGEFDQIQSSLSTHAERSAAIEQASTDAQAAEMTWGMPGWFGMDDAYRDNCEGILEVLADITAALEGNAAELTACRDAYQDADDQITADFESLQLELES